MFNFNLQLLQKYIFNQTNHPGCQKHFSLSRLHTCWLLCGLKKPDPCCCFVRSWWCCGVACGSMLVVCAGCVAPCEAGGCWVGWTAAVAEGGTLIPTPGKQESFNTYKLYYILTWKICANKNCYGPTVVCVFVQMTHRKKRGSLSTTKRFHHSKQWKV